MTDTIKPPQNDDQPSLPEMVRAELEKLRKERDKATADRDRANAALEALISNRIESVGGWKR